MNKFIITLLVFISLSLSKSSSPVAVSQARAILTADIIFEGEIINLENDEATIKIITPIWNDINKKEQILQKEIKLPFSYKTHYSLRGQIPDLNKRAIFAFKMDEKTKKIKHFFWAWYITRLENNATQYYVGGVYSKAERQYVSSEDIVNGIKLLRKSYNKNLDLDAQLKIKAKVALTELEKVKENNMAIKIWIEDVEAYNKQIKK